MAMEFGCSDLSAWDKSLSAYSSRIESLNKPDLVSLDRYYRDELPLLLQQRNPNPFITTDGSSRVENGGTFSVFFSVSIDLYIRISVMSRTVCVNFRPRLLDFVSNLDEEVVKTASQKAFQSLPELSKAVSELTVLKGVGPATASAILAAYAPNVAPFMSDEAMVVALGSSKDYSAKQYLLFASKLQAKAKELSSDEATFTPSDVERALWSSVVGEKLLSSKSDADHKTSSKGSGGKRKR